MVSRVGKVVGVGAVIVLALVVVLTALRTELPHTPGVMSDALGPDPGEPVGEYLARAAASLGGDDDDAATTATATGSGAGHTGSDTGDTDSGDTGREALRWALVTAEQPWSVDHAAAAVSGVPRLSRVYVQTPLPDVAMPVGMQTLAEPVVGERSREPVLVRALERAAHAAQTRADSGAGRSAYVEALTAERARAGEPAIIGLVVRADSAELRAVAGGPGVRAVEALPADAVWGRFAVRPLLPQQLEAADPLPDRAPVGTG